MMLRALVATLVIANLAFWAWSQGALQAIGLAPQHQRDPARLDRQLRPDAVRVLPPAAAAALPAAGAASNPMRAAPACLEAGPFTAANLEAAERALAAALPAGSWVRVSQDVAAQFAVALGPFATRDAQQKKGDELGRLQISFEETSLPGEAAGAPPLPAFLLGRYDRRSDAETALAAFNARGVRTARVVTLRQAGSEWRLRADRASPAAAEQLHALGAVAPGVRVAACATPPAAR